MRSAYGSAAIAAKVVFVAVGLMLSIAGCHKQPAQQPSTAPRTVTDLKPVHLPSAKEVQRLLGEAPLSQLADRVYLGDGRAALDDLGFAPDREEHFASRMELGELGVFGPRTVDPWGGTAYIEGDVAAGNGCLAFAREGRPVIWVHADVAWLEQRLPQDEHYPRSVGEQFRNISYLSHLEQGEAKGGQGLPGWFQLELDAKAVTVRLSEAHPADGSAGVDRLDIYLSPGRVRQLGRN